MILFALWPVLAYLSGDVRLCLGSIAVCIAWRGGGSPWWPFHGAGSLTGLVTMLARRLRT